MTREHILMILGTLVLLSPWSGIPMAWLQWILLTLGAAILGIALMQRARRMDSAADSPLPPSVHTVPTHPSDEPKPRSSHIAFS